MTKRVVVTGLGVVSPVGNNIDTFWNNLKNGVNGIDIIKGFETDDLPAKVGGELKDFNPEDYDIPASFVKKHDKYSVYAVAAAHQAMKQSGLSAKEDGNIDPSRLGVYVGSGMGGFLSIFSGTEKLLKEGPKWVSPLFIPTIIPNIGSAHVAIIHNANGPCVPISTACSTSSHTIGEAYRSIKHGYADAIIAGGSEAPMLRFAIAAFGNARALSNSEDPDYASIPFNKNRKGFVLAEGAAVIVMEEYEHAIARGATILAEVCGYGNTIDAYHITAPRPDGSTQSAAIIQAIKEAGYTSEDKLYINAHGTGTPLNDVCETAAIKLALGDDAYKAHISSTKSMTGHMMGAAGATEAIACILALKDGIIPPTINLDEKDPECDLDYTPNKAVKSDISMALSISLGFGGHNACIAFKKFK